MTTQAAIVVVAVLALLALAVGIYRYRARLRIRVLGLISADADFSREPHRGGVRARKLNAGRNVRIADRAGGDVAAHDISAGDDISLEREDGSSEGK